MRNLSSNIRGLAALAGLGIGVITILSIATRIDNITSYLTRAFGTPANIIVDASGVLGVLNQPWRNIAQGGESPTYSYASAKEHIIELSPEYIRIDHIYDFYNIVSKDENGIVQYNWQKLDTVLSDITAAGAKPFISLSYMPPELAGGDIIGKPHNYQEWSDLVQNTIQHISGRQSLNIEDVYYEVWNEPDLFGQWKTYGEKNYLDLYHHAALGAKRTSNTNTYFFGGPATTDLYPNWVTRVVEYTIKHNLPLDFYSWHLYSEDPQDFSNSINTFDRLMRKYPDKIFSIKPMITEWGHDSAIHPGYDTNLAAAHAIAVSSLIHDKIDKAFVFELQDGKDPNGQEFWGRWGMLTHQEAGSQRKPRFHAIKALNQLDGRQLSVVGEGTWVRAIATRNEGGQISILLTNYDYKGSNTENVPVSIKRLEAKSYEYRKQYLNKPEQTTIITPNEGSLDFSMPLAPNDSVLLTLSPQ